MKTPLKRKAKRGSDQEPFKAIPAPQFDPNLSGGNAAAWALTAAKNLDALMDRYGIDSGDANCWHRLSMALATEFVPNFAPKPEKPPQGRRSEKGSLSRDVDLFFELGKAEAAGKSVLNTARRLAAKHQEFRDQNPNTLRQRFYTLKDAASPEGKRLRSFVHSILLSDKA